MLSSHEWFEFVNALSLDEKSEDGEVSWRDQTVILDARNAINSGIMRESKYR